MRYRRPAPHQIERIPPERLGQEERHPVTVVLHDVRSLYNVGAVFRTADAARLDKVYLCGITGCPPHPQIEKVALGATATVPWEYEWNTLAVVRRLRREGHRIAALEIARPSRLYTDVRADEFPLALLLGHETWGLGQAVLDACDLVVEIPQFGAKRSLNVAVAFGIAAFELIRIWRTGQQRW